MEFNDAGPITQELLLSVKKKCIYLSYGEFEGLKVPSVAELYMLRGLIDGAIQEMTDRVNAGADK